MEKIKIEIVNIFNILEKKEMEDKDKKKYTLLKKIYQKINMNDNLIMKLNKELMENKETLHNLTIFKKTNFKEIYEQMNEVQKKEINDKIMNIESLTLKSIMGEEHTCGDNCEHHTSDLFDPNQLMNNKKMQKILNNKKLRYNLEQQLRKTTGMKKSSLEEILKTNIPKEQKKMFDQILNNETVKKIKDKVLNEENMIKIKDVFLEIVDRDDVKVELDKFRCIINEDKFIESISNIYTKFQETQELTDIEKLVKENTDLQEILKRVDTAFKNDTLNIERLKELLKTIVMEFISKVQTLNIIDKSDINKIKNLGGQFNLVTGFFGDKKPIEDKKTKKEKEKKRRDKARKEYRRKLRNKYKNTKQNKKNPRGGSV